MPQCCNLLLKVRHLNAGGQKKSVAITGRPKVALFIQTHCFHDYACKKLVLQKLLTEFYSWLSIKHLPEGEIGSSESQNKVLSHCFKQNIELLNRQMRSSTHFQYIQNCIFFLDKFELEVNHFKLTEVFNIFHLDFYHSSSICW